MTAGCQRSRATCARAAGETPYSLSKDTLLEFGRHTRVHLNRDTLLGLLEDPDCQVTGSGSNLEDDVGRLQVGLRDSRRQR